MYYFKANRGSFMKIKSRKLFLKFKGSSLVEVLVAIAICMTIFSIALAILLKANQENSTRLKLQANLFQEELITKVRLNGIEENTDFVEQEGLIVQFEYTDREDYANMKQVTIRILSKNGTPLAIKTLIVPASKK